MDVSLISLGLGWYKKTQRKNTTKKEKKKENQLNQVRLHLHNASRTHLDVNLRYHWMSVSLVMRFAHLLKTCNVRFMFRFAQHCSHHMSSVHIDFLLICSLHISYVREFLGVSEAPCLLAFRGGLCAET